MKDNKKKIRRKFIKGNSIDFKFIDNLEILEESYSRIKRANLSGLGLKKLPDIVFKFQNLKVLVLSNNKLKKVPPEIKLFSKLEVLILSSNRLEELPDEIMELKNLKEINLSNNYFYNFPEKLTSVKNLERVWIAKNQLKIIPDKLMNCLKLKEVYLKNNPLIAPFSEIAQYGLYGLKNYFENIELNEKIEDVKQITVKKLIIENIGAFNRLELDFDKELTCLIGLNGTGKTTVLRALALALIGYKHRDIMRDKLDNLLKLTGTKGHLQKGKIELLYSVEGHETKSILIFEVEDGYIRKIAQITPKIYTLRKDRKDLLNLLIAGYTQNREAGKYEIGQPEYLDKPNVLNVIPLINGQSDNRLNSFARWLIDLESEAIRIENRMLREHFPRHRNSHSGNNNNKEILAQLPDYNIKEREIIRIVFSILSEITGEKIRLKEIVNNRDIWVTTPYNPDGILLQLLSLGFQDIIGWVGRFIQAMAEAYPDSKDFTRESAICLVDEVDVYMHPSWQRRIITILNRIFTNTQFIIATHSPFIAQSARNIIVFKYEKNKLVAYHTKNNELSYNAVSRELFDVTSPFSINIERKLQEFREIKVKVLKRQTYDKDRLNDIIDELTNSGAEVESVMRRELNSLERQTDKTNLL